MVRGFARKKFFQLEFGTFFFLSRSKFLLPISFLLFVLIFVIVVSVNRDDIQEDDIIEFKEIKIAKVPE